MRRSAANRVFAWIAVLLGLACAMPAQTAQAPFSVTISIQRDSVQSGDSIWIDAVLTNVSEHDIVVHQSGPQCDYTVDVWDHEGHPVRDTDLGHRRKTRGCATERNVQRTLKPHEKLADHILISAMRDENFAFRSLYDLSMPGKYTIQIVRKIPRSYGNGVVRSNVIALTVTDKSR